MRDADLPEARQDLERELGWPDIPQPIWAELVAYHRTDIEQGFGTQDWEDVAVLAREIQAGQRGQAGYTSPPGRPPTEERPAWQLKPEELERSWAFSEYVSRIAGAVSSVRRFRAQYLDGKTIRPNRACALLTSPAAAIWSSLHFDKYGVSLLEHTHRVVEEGHDDRGRYSLVEIHDTVSGARKRLKDGRPLETGAWSVSEPAKDALSNSEDLREIKDWQLLSFPEEEHGINHACVWMGSVLGELHKCVQELIRRYPWWEPEAVWFVLTGDTPWVEPVSVQARGTQSDVPAPASLYEARHGGVIYGQFERQFVTIKVEPWVSEETVRRTYREAQVRLLQGDNRPAKNKQLRLFRFVSARTDPFTLYEKERARAARELVPEWDRENPTDTYGNDTRRFWRDYDRALLLIARPIAAAEDRGRQRPRREELREKKPDSNATVTHENTREQRQRALIRNRLI